MRGVRELEFRVREQKFVALGVSALVDGIPASDRRYYPLYAKAAELDIPVRIYSSMNYATDRPTTSAIRVTSIRWRSISPS